VRVPNLIGAAGFVEESVFPVLELRFTARQRLNACGDRFPRANLGDCQLLHDHPGVQLQISSVVGDTEATGPKYRLDTKPVTTIDGCVGQ